MAPEIRNNMIYDGRQTDIFSMGVIIFSLVVGHFPFKISSENDDLFNLLINGYKNDKGINEEYWKAI